MLIKHEITQTEKGIYDGKKLIANFKITGADLIESNKIKIEFLDCFNNPYERVGSVNIFNDVKRFRHFLSSLSLTYLGSLNNLQDLKMYINKNFIQ